MALEDKKAGMLKRQKKEKMRKIILYSSLAILFAGLIIFGIDSANRPGELDDFAQCISESGAVFYGTSWCPFCQQQKEMFGKSQKYLHYVECSGGRSGSISEECRNLGIQSVPAWINEGETYQGLQQLDRLAEITGCEII